MTFDELYDEMLSLEFSSRGRHAKAGTIGDPAAAAATLMAGDVCTGARHAKADLVDEVAEPAAEGRERRTGLARYRTAGLVGAGGLACATVGAFLGGLGGYFTVSPAGAHAVASTSQDSPAVATASHAPYPAHSAAEAAAIRASFSPASGGLTSAGSGLGSVTAAPSPNAPVGGGSVGAPLPGNGSGGSTGGGSNGGGSTGGNNPPSTTPTTPGDSTTPCTGVGCVVGVSGLPSLPPLPPPPPIPTPVLPVSPPPVSVPTVPTSPVSVPVPAPLPTTPPVSVGPVSVGTTSTGGGTTLNVGL